MNTAVEWFKNMRIELDSARRHWRATRAQLAPDFNALHFLRKDEYGLSVILANLLDPEGSHGQGSLFLKRFIERFWEGRALNCEGALVCLEASTESRRRMDIKIRFGDDAVLGIESKLCYAVDQDRQVHDYLVDLGRSRAAAHRLIYLTPKPDMLPGENSIVHADRVKAEKDGQLLCTCASKLADWLSECVGSCKAERIRAFLLELIDHLKTELQGIENVNEHHLIVEAALKDAGSARDALQIAAAADAIRDKLLSHFAAEVEQHVSAGLPEGWEVKLDLPLSLKHHGIGLRPKMFSTHQIRLEFCKGGATNVVIGIAKNEESDSNERMGDVRTALVNDIGQGNEDKWWPWWRPFEPDNWGQSPEAMALILDEGENGMVARTLREFTRILDVLRKYSLVDNFGVSASGG